MPPRRVHASRLVVPDDYPDRGQRTFEDMGLKVEVRSTRVSAPPAPPPPPKRQTRLSTYVLPVAAPPLRWRRGVLRWKPHGRKKGSARVRGQRLTASRKFKEAGRALGWKVRRSEDGRSLYLHGPDACVVLRLRGDGSVRRSVFRLERVADEALGEPDGVGEDDD